MKKVNYLFLFFVIIAGTISGCGIASKKTESLFEQRLRLAKQGDPNAQYSIASDYVSGSVVRRDANEAIKWYRKAAEQGHANAQYNLGVMYLEGEGVTQDYAEAAKWYKLAAEQGDDKAQNNLGLIYSLKARLYRLLSS